MWDDVGDVRLEIISKNLQQMKTQLSDWPHKTMTHKHTVNKSPVITHGTVIEGRLSPFARVCIRALNAWLAAREPTRLARIPYPARRGTHVACVPRVRLR